MSPESIATARALLTASLSVWKVAGHVEPGDAPAVAEVRADDGTVVRVEPASEDERPVRWWVRWASPGSETRARPAASVVGMLKSVRMALGAEGGNRLRIAPAPSEP